MGPAAQGAAKLGGHVSKTALLGRLFDAFNAGDIDTIAEHCHPDVELRLTELYTPPGTAYHGRTGLRTLLEAVFPRVGVARLEPAGMRVLGNAVLVDLRVHVNGGRRAATVLYTFDGSLIRRVEEFASEADAVGATVKGAVLTPREREVFQLLARGRTGPQIAAQLVLSPQTVRTHVQNGVERLGAKTRVQAVAMALARGEISV